MDVELFGSLAVGFCVLSTIYAPWPCVGYLLELHYGGLAFLRYLGFEPWHGASLALGGYYLELLCFGLFAFETPCVSVMEAKGAR